MINDETKYKDFENLEGEIWRDIQFAQGKYQISNAARVRNMSIGKKPLETPKIVNVSNWKGQTFVNLYTNKKYQYYRPDLLRNDYFTKDEFIELDERINRTNI